MGGGTKLIRTLLPGGTEGICSGMGDGVGDPSGDVKGEGDSSGTAEGVGAGDSCAVPTETKAIRSAKLTLVVMSSEVETSRNSSENIERFLDFARNDKWAKRSTAN
jgi:hypothetical protein